MPPGPESRTAANKYYLNLNVVGEWERNTDDVVWLCPPLSVFFSKCILLGTWHNEVRYCLAHSAKAFLGQDTAKHVVPRHLYFPLFPEDFFWKKCYLLLINFPLSSEANFRKEVKNSAVLSSVFPMTPDSKCFFCTSSSSNLGKQSGGSFLMAEADSLLILPVISSSFSLHFLQSSYITKLSRSIVWLTLQSAFLYN